RSTSCMAAVAVIALVIEAIHTTVSSVIGASLPSSRRPTAPSYSTPLSVAAIAMMPGIVFDSTASLNRPSMIFMLCLQLVKRFRATRQDLPLRLRRQLRPVRDQFRRAGEKSVRVRIVRRPEDFRRPDEVRQHAQAPLDGLERDPAVALEQ